MAPSRMPALFTENPRTAFDVERDDHTKDVDPRAERRRQSFEEDVRQSPELPDEPPPGWARS